MRRKIARSLVPEASAACAGESISTPAAQCSHQAVGALCAPGRITTLRRVSIVMTVLFFTFSNGGARY
jgi:hypothetical protein